MKATMRFSHRDKSFDEGDMVEFTHEDDVNYLMERGLIKGSKPDDLTPESKSLTEKELADLSNAGEKKKLSTVKEKSEGGKPAEQKEKKEIVKP